MSICPHLHICAQAGDDEILKQMRRNYDTAYYRDLFGAVRERLPEAALGSDIIVGFPGETDAQFESSLEYFAILAAHLFSRFSVFVAARHGRGVVAGCMCRRL